MTQQLFPEPDEQQPLLPRPFEIAPSGVAPAESLRRTLNRAATRPPDTAAEILELQFKTGLPGGVIERNLDEVRQKASEQTFDVERFRRDNPHLTEWILADPFNASVSSDDRDNLSLFERSMNAGKNVGLSLLKGAISVPEAAVGLVDIPTLGRVGKALEEIGFRPAEAKTILDTYYSDRQRRAFLAVQDARGVIDKAVTALSNPSTILHTAIESAPLMLGGAGIARGLLRVAPRAGALIAGAAGEGAAGAGIAAEQTRVSEESGTLAPGQAGLAAATGTLTGAISLLGGRIAQQLGIGDIDTLLAGAAREASAARGLTARVLAGAVSEGLFEELPQSVQEQVLQNAAQGRPLSDGLDDAIVMGTLVGSLMGAGVNVLPASSPSQDLITDLHQRTAGSKTFDRSKPAFNDFAQRLANVGLKDVTVPIDPFIEYFQSKGEDPSAVSARLTGDPEAFSLAQDTGELVLPTARYLTQIVGSGHEPFFEQEIRVGDLPNGREFAERVAEQDAQRQAEAIAAEGAGQRAGATADATAIHAQTVQELMRTGRVDEATANELATVMAEAFPNIAARAGADLATLAMQWLPQAQRGTTAETAPATPELEQGEPVPPPFTGVMSLEDIAREGNRRLQKAMLEREAAGVPRGTVPQAPPGETTVQGGVEAASTGEVSTGVRPAGALEGVEADVPEAVRQAIGGERTAEAAAELAALDETATAAQAALDQTAWRGLNTILRMLGQPPIEAGQAEQARVDRAIVVDRLKTLAFAGGFTYSPQTDTHPSTGFALPVFPGRELAVPVDELTEQIITDYIAANQDVLTTPGAHVGAWLNPDDNRVYLDISQVVQDEEEARILAESHAQLAYYDLAKGVTINVAEKADLARFAEEAQTIPPGPEGQPGGRVATGGRPEGREESLAGLARTTFEQRPASELEPAPAFYSRLNRAVEESKLAKATGGQWKATIRNSRIGVNKDEFAIARIEDLDDKTVYTRAEILAYLKQNRPRLEVVTLEGATEIDEDDLQQRRDDIADRMVDEAESDFDWGDVLGTATYEEDEVEEEEERELDVDTGEVDDEGNAIIETETYYETVTVTRYYPAIEGGYRERGVDRATGRPRYGVEERRETEILYDEGPFDDESDAEEAAKRYLRDVDREPYYEHVSDMVREGIDYDEVDRQAREELEAEGGGAGGRYSEYQLKPEAEAGTYQEVFITAGDVVKEGGGTYRWHDGHDLYKDIDNPIVRIRLNIRETVGEGLPGIPTRGGRVLFLEEVQPPRPEQQPKMPPIFVKHWREIAFKWALRRAAELELDAVAWTTGAQQADRYSLRKKVNKVTSEDITEGSPAWEAGHRKLVRVDIKDGPALVMHIAKDGVVSSILTDFTNRWDNLIGQPLGAVIGDELSVDLLKPGEQRIEGKGLRVGGEGLKTLYDYDFRNVVNALPAVKKFGGKVGTVTIRAKQELAIAESRLTDAQIADYNLRLVEPPPHIPVVDESTGEVVHLARSRDDAWRWAAANSVQPTEQPALLMTPELVDAVNAGQALFQGARGRVRFREAEGLPPLITLFRSTNRSTFLHEAGHVFLRLQGNLADQLATHDEVSLTDQQRRLLSDYRDVVLPFLGVTSTAEIGAREHEKWARSWEAYLMTGKAPSAKLRPVFARISRWLTRIYRTLQGLSREAGVAVELNPEIEAVMARLLASDAAIEQAEREAKVSPIFTTAADAKVTPDEFDGYRQLVEEASLHRREQLTQRMMKDLRREERLWWRRERVEVREEVTAEIQDSKLYRAWFAVRRGMAPDGGPMTSGAANIPLKLSKADLVQQFGKDILPQLRGLYTEGGLPADLVAPMLDYASGAELVRALSTAAPMKQVIDATTDQRMREMHGDLLTTPGELAEEAQKAVADTQRDKVIRAEMAMLNKLKAATAPVKAAQREQQRTIVRRLRSEMPDAATLARVAAAQSASWRVVGLRPDRFFAAAGHASQRATEMAAKGKVDEALQAKQDELINLALYRAAQELEDEVQAAQKEFARMFGPDATMARRRNMDYVAAARALAAHYFFPEQRLEKARDALLLVKNYNPDSYQVLQAQLDRVLATSPDRASLTGHAFRDMREVVRSLWKQSLRDRQQLIDGALVDRAEIVEQLNAHLDALGPPKGPRTELVTGLLGLRAALTRVEHWVSFVDKQNPNGVFRRYIFQPIADAVGRYRTAKIDTFKRFLTILEPIKKTLVSGQIVAPELNYAFTSKAALLHAIAHTGNESNLERLLRGRNWVASIAPDAPLDTSLWQRFIARMYREGVVTKPDMDFVQALWDLNESLKPAAQQAHREMFGHYFNEITAQPVVTPFGAYRGGYVPAILDPFDSADGTAKINLDAIEGVHQTMFPQPGFTQQRAEHYAQPLALDLSLMPQHLDKVLRFIHVLPRAKEVNRLVADRRFRERLHAYDPVAGGDMLQPWLQRAYSQQVTVPSKTAGGRMLDRVARALRGRTGLNMMAINIVNVLQQYTGLFTAFTKVKPKHLSKALWRFINAPRAITDEIHRQSPFMATTGTGQVAEILRSMDDLLLNPSKYEKVTEFAAQHGYVLQVMTQNLVSNVTWSGAFEQAVERGMEEREAVRFADSVIRETQGSFNAEDLSSVEVQAPFIRLFLMFFGWANMMANLNAHQLASTVRDMGLRKGAGRALFLYSFGFMLPVVLGEVIRQAAGGWEDDDDETHIDEVLWLFFGSQGRMLAQMVPGGQVATAVAGFFDDLPYNDRISVSPAITMLESVARAPKSVYEAVMEEGPKRQAVRDALSAIGLLTGLPAGALMRPAGYLADIADERTEPETPTELIQGLVSGRSQEAR